MPEGPPSARKIDRFLDGRLQLRQSATGHRAGTDAVLLAAALGSPEGMLIDAGAGAGAAGLMMAQRAPALEALLVEFDPESAHLARGNIALNGLENRVRVIEADLLSAKARRAAGLEDRSADVVVTNPPWIAPGRSRVSPDARRALAHVAGAGGLEGWLRAVAAIAKPDALMAIILRGEDLKALLDACEGRFGALAILPVHPRATDAAIRIVATGRRGARAAARLLPGLVLHDRDGNFTPRAQALHRGEATLDLA